MSTKLLFTICSMALSFAMFAQTNKPPAEKIHKIVFHLASDDTLVHRGLMKQLNNVLMAAPGSRIEVICHGPGIDMLLREKTLVLDQIQGFKSKAVAFKACENTLRDKNVSKDKIITEADFIPSALVAIVIRQEEGWSYIKAGF